MKPLSPEITRGISELAQRVELIQVRALEFDSRLLSDPPPAGERIHLDLNTEVQVARTDGRFVLDGRFTVKARSAEKEPFIALRVRLAAAYTVEGDVPSDETLEAFSRTNGMIHLWPYFRAYVQQVCGMHGIAPMVIPTFRIKTVSRVAT